MIRWTVYSRADCSLCERLERGAVLLIDYGFGESEYYHSQRHMGTLVCHHQHRVDHDPLVRLGEKDITAHVNFTGIALAAQDSFGRLLAGSIALTLFVYVFMNVGMVIGQLPVVGVPLPFVSYGGTAAVTLMAGFGILMSIHTHRRRLSLSL